VYTCARAQSGLIEHAANLALGNLAADNKDNGEAIASFGAIQLILDAMDTVCMYYLCG
jgi:hypothetical protein